MEWSQSGFLKLNSILIYHTFYFFDILKNKFFIGTHPTRLNLLEILLWKTNTCLKIFNGLRKSGWVQLIVFWYFFFEKFVKHFLLNLSIFLLFFICQHKVNQIFNFKFKVFLTLNQIQNSFNDVRFCFLRRNDF